MGAQKTETNLSPWWLRSLLIAMVVGFAILLLITKLAYHNAPPIPQRIVDEQGVLIADRHDIEEGQTIFLRYGLMNNGTIWGHGGYLGPDFSATALHRMAGVTAQFLAEREYKIPASELNQMQRAAVDAQVAVMLKTNRYDANTEVLVLTAPQAQAWLESAGYWAAYFKDPADNGGLRKGLITDQTEIRQLSAFIEWASWASVANRPGENYSYTNNFPYDPDVGNTPVGGALLWSALSLIVLLGGMAAVLYVSGRFKNLGWVSPANDHCESRLPPQGQATPGQKALVKFFVVVALLFFVQTLLGGAVAHYRSEPGDFYGLPLEDIFPSNLLRSWHLQAAIFWIATAYVAAALFLGTTLRKTVLPKMTLWINLLFVAFFVVIVGSMLGIWAGLWQWLGKYWFLFGNQGWEYLELGRVWQMLLLVGLVAWFILLFMLSRPKTLASKDAAPIVKMFLFAALAIPVFYVPALFFGEKTNFTVVDTWRFWIIHLWVEGFFEFFATTIVALLFYQLGITRRNVALRVIYFDAILYFAGGLVGTGHHWYFNGQSQFNMAASALVSALEVVPLTLLTLEAWSFVRTTRNVDPNPQSRQSLRYKWVFYFLIATGFWNFMGAGVMGFLINLPIVSYYEVGTIFTAGHGHAAMMGVFGMLALGMMVLVLQQVSSEANWKKLEKYVGISFWGTNIGLVLMIVISLFPGGVLQLWDVIENGYWHARSLNYTAGHIARLLEWFRLLGDTIFILFGSLPVAIFALSTWLKMIKEKASK